MIRLELVNIIKNQFPDLDIYSPEGVIEFSKVVKTETKLLGSLGFSLQEIDEVISFLSTHGNALFPLINHKNIAIILRGQGEDITLTPVKEKVAEEDIQKFRELFSENIHSYIKQCINLNGWNNLKNLFIAYPFIINNSVKNETLKALSLQNQAIVMALQNKDYVTFVEQNVYATDVGYFSILNAIDTFYFDEEISQINRALITYPKTPEDFTHLGKMMYALSFYNAYNESVKQALLTSKRAAFTMLNMTDTSSSSSSATYSGNSGCVVYIVILICYLVFCFMAAAYLPSEVLTILFFIINLIFFIIEKSR